MGEERTHDVRESDLQEREHEIQEPPSPPPYHQQPQLQLQQDQPIFISDPATDPPTDPERRINEVGVQMLSRNLHTQLFPHHQRKPLPEQIDIATHMLKQHQLYGKNLEPVPDIRFQLPALQGRDINEHFRRLGEDQSREYIGLSKRFAGVTLPTPPETDRWVLKDGWMRYNPDGTTTAVEGIDEKAIVFDVEVLMESDEPMIAVAASETCWYGWVSPSLTNWAHNPVLIGLGLPRDVPSIVVGHNVGYDRARVKEEYHINPTKISWIDTMSLHGAVAGLTAQQRPSWMIYKKARDKAPSDELVKSDLETHIRQDWHQQVSPNSLAEVAKLYTDESVDKQQRNVFVKGTRVEVRQRFRELMDYCAKDVEITHKVFKKTFPRFLRKCPHPASFAGMMHMGKGYLPTNSDWGIFLNHAETTCNNTVAKIEEQLVSVAQCALRYMKDEKWREDRWLKALNWEPKYYNATNKETGVNKRGHEYKLTPDHVEKMIALDGKPKWYRDLWVTKERRIRITSAKRVTPYLLRLSWRGYHIHWTRQYGWTFVVPKSHDNSPFVSKQGPLEFSPDEADPTYDHIASHDHDHFYYRIPHAKGDKSNCGNPLGKTYIPFFEDGTLAAQFVKARDILVKTAECSYWIQSRQRILNQLVVMESQGMADFGGIEAPEGKEVGVILPQSVVMGTVTRRAVEATWMTAANAKKNAIGSELKAKIQAPVGWTFVGADVDSQELWIASLLADSQLRIHGGTPIGFMTLQGSKVKGTDLHAKTGSILGITRDQAKQFNYARIYGAGPKFAKQTLMQCNPNLKEVMAHRKAVELYRHTKGTSIKNVRGSRRWPRQYWSGGTESFLFNKLEEIAIKRPKTPALECEIPNGLMPQFVHAEYMRSRVNWVVQSSGVDYLHLLLVSMTYLFNLWNIKGRFSLSIHDEVRFLVKSEDKLVAALALQVSNLWVRAFFARKVGMDDLPLNVGFFSAIDLDHCLRKEVDMACVTPSNQTPVPVGEKLDIYQLLEKIDRDPDLKERISAVQESHEDAKPMVVEERMRETVVDVKWLKTQCGDMLEEEEDADGARSTTKGGMRRKELGKGGDVEGVVPEMVEDKIPKIIRRVKMAPIEPKPTFVKLSRTPKEREKTEMVLTEGLSPPIGY
ncbi:DNA-directed DNA polymerase gamma mip1 [Quaeritorhiza haematococci]|nr:DNA-directed DNA polymerase gamma mip1 [Quaeritorhiza haematococci]